MNPALNFSNPRSTDAERKRICFVATVPFVLKWFLSPHILALKEDHDITLVATGTADDIAGLLGEHVSFIPLRIERKISLKNDILSLIRLWNFFRKEKFQSVHSIMPKAGLLAMVASRLAGVPFRFHTFTGQVWATQKGLRRLFLKYLDKVLAQNATRVLADSPSQRTFLIANGVVNASRIDVLAEGSIAGVDVKRFQRDPEIRNRIRTERGVPGDALVFLFIGRLTRDKGLIDLARAFEEAAKRNVRLHLMVVGSDEEGLDAEFAILAQKFQGRVHRIGFTNRPEDYLSAADVFCLPSYREGFGSVLIEAAAAGLPAVASRIYGITDAVEENVTGILHAPGSYQEITDSMLRLASDQTLRDRMGQAAQVRASERFSETRVTQAFTGFYRILLSKSSPI